MLISIFLFLKHICIHHPFFMQNGDIFILLPLHLLQISEMSIQSISSSKLYALKYLIFLSVQFSKIEQLLGKKITRSVHKKINLKCRVKIRKRSLNRKELKDTLFMNRSTWLHTAQFLHILSYQRRKLQRIKYKEFVSYKRGQSWAEEN